MQRNINIGDVIYGQPFNVDSMTIEWIEANEPNWRPGHYHTDFVRWSTPPAAAAAASESMEAYQHYYLPLSSPNDWMLPNDIKFDYHGDTSR